SILGQKPVPSININDKLTALDNLKLPSSLTDGIDKLNASIPTFADVNNFTSNIIRLPFEEVKKLINETMVDYKFDRSAFPVPQREQLSFCSDNNGINGFFDSIAALVRTAQKVFIGVLLVAAIAACVPMAWHEIRRWRLMKERSVLVGKDAHDPMDVVYI